MNAPNIPKLNGGDVELCNFFTGVDSPGGTGSRAALALLRKIDGAPNNRQASGGVWQCPRCRSERESRWEQGGGGSYYSTYGTQGGGYNPQDWMRTFLPGNGGCVYIDLTTWKYACRKSSRRGTMWRPGTRCCGCRAGRRP